MKIIQELPVKRVKEIHVLKAIFLACLMMLGWSVYSQDATQQTQNPPPKTEIKEGSQEMKSGAKETWHGTKKAAKGVGHQTKKTAKKVAHKTKKAAHDVKEDMK